MAVVVKINPRRLETHLIKKAANVIRRGGLVVFPTETFYGLGANAFDPRAVRKIFRAKGRPENKALIILIGEKVDLRLVARDIPKVAYRLIEKFWPGPLTLIFKKKKNIPKEVTAGGNTVAVRLSSHPVAQALVRAAGVPITAPSANLSGRPPHRTITGVVKELGRCKEIGLFLDAGKTPLGKPGSENSIGSLKANKTLDRVSTTRKPSTLLDLTKNPPRILREGGITKKQLEKVIGRIT